MFQTPSWRLYLVLLALLAAGAGARPGVPVGGISGALLDQDRRPIPGALVTLYERGTGYLVDSTYTRPDGRFDLRPPSRKVGLDLVALKGEKSVQASLPGYDPAAPGIYREVVLRQGKSLAAEAWDFLVSKLEWIVGSIAAFLLGYLLKQWEESRSARRTLGRRVADLVGLETAARRQFADSTQGLKKEVITDADYRKILADLGPRIAALETELPKSEDALFILRGVEGGRKYAEYRDRIQQIREIADAQEGVGWSGAAAGLEKLSDLLAGLDASSLTGSPSGWQRWRPWRRTASTS